MIPFPLPLPEARTFFFKITVRTCWAPGGKSYRSGSPWDFYLSDLRTLSLLHFILYSSGFLGAGLTSTVGPVECWSFRFRLSTLRLGQSSSTWEWDQRLGLPRTEGFAAMWDLQCWKWHSSRETGTFRHLILIPLFITALVQTILDK